MTQQTVSNRGLKTMTVLGAIMSFFSDPNNIDYEAPAGRTYGRGQYKNARACMPRELVKSRRRMRKASQRRNRQ